ncbi:MAG TPA: hypothetical protein VN946_13510 [Terriglobales bacterium]|nr:hypothetical protein [Terriglobales bacterium]
MHEVSRRAWGLRLRRTKQQLALSLLLMLPSANIKDVGVRDDLFGAEYPPRLSLVYASLGPSRYQCKTQGQVDRYSFLVRLFHPLLHAGLSRRTNILNYASDRFLRHLPIVYVLTVIGRTEGDRLAVRGLFIGDDVECFHRAAALSLKVNFETLDAPIRKAVVYLDPHEFHSTWLGNKAIYRTRMALADGAELIILAPGVKEFGEDKDIDALIRKYGYCGTPATLEAVSANADLRSDLSAAAHLIHGSSEGRFTIRWCPRHLTSKEVEGVGFEYGDLKTVLARYDPQKLRYGYNFVDGEDVFFIPHPGLGLWAYRGKLLGRKA